MCRIKCQSNYDIESKATNERKDGRLETDGRLSGV